MCVCVCVCMYVLYIYMYSTPKTITCIYMYCTYNIYSTIYQKQELFIDKHEGITSNKVYAQAKITSYMAGS